MPKKIWDNCQLIGEVKKSERTKLKIELVARDGVKYINIREWYMKKTDNEWKPGMSGFAIPLAIPIDGNVKHPVTELANLVAEGINKAYEFELEDEANAVWSMK